MLKNLTRGEKIALSVLLTLLGITACVAIGLIVYQLSNYATPTTSLANTPTPISTIDPLSSGGSFAAPGAPDLAVESDSGISNTDNITNITTPRFTGTCTDGENINLTSSINGLMAPADVVCAGGQYDITLTSALSDGAHSITATASDASGNSSPASLGLNLTMDTTPPSPPGTPDLSPGSDTGASNTDNITSDINPQFTGICTQDDQITIHSSVDGDQLPSITCAVNGYDINLTSNLSEVTHTISAKAIDAAGNSSISAGLIVTVETAAPSAPGTPDLAAGSDTGISNTDNITNDTTPQLTGLCTSGDVIVIHSSLNGDLSPTRGCADGRYDITVTSTLSEGVHSISARAVNAAGNSFNSLGLTLTVDTSLPPTPGAPDLAAGSDSGISNTDNITNDTTPQFVGTCSSGDRIILNSSAGGVLLPSNYTCTNNAYDIVVSSLLSEVIHNITAAAIDTAGNSSPASGVLSVTVDTIAPAAPGTPDLAPGSDTGASNSDNITSDTTPQFTGTCTTGDYLTLSSSVDGQLNPADALCSGGGYDISVTSTLTLNAHNITAKAKDLAGNLSSASAALGVTVQAATPTVPGTPDMTADSDSGSSDSDNITNDTTPRFTGACVTGDKINLSSNLSGALQPPNTLCAAGSYDISVTTILSQDTHSITAKATNPEGFTSSASSGLSITIDLIAPAAPGAPDLASGSDTGASNSDDITSDTTPQFTGSCESGATVTLSSSVSGVLAPAGTCSSGAFDITLTSVLSEGAHNITAAQMDVAGNGSGSSPALGINIVIPVLLVSVSGNTGVDAITTTGGTPSEGQLNCPATRCDTGFALDDNVTLNVTVDAASGFVSWGGDCAAFGSNLSGILAMSSDKTCTASFAPTPKPEIDVEGNVVSIADGDASPDAADHTDFGNVSVGGYLDRTFTIQNEGTDTLTLTDFPAVVTLSGSGDFSVQTQPGSGAIAAGGGDLTFVVRCTPSGAGALAATVSIANNDANENPYDFQLACAGTTAPEMDVQRPVASSIVDGGTDDVGNQAVGTVSVRYILDNSAGSAQLSVSAVVADNLSNASGFTLVSSLPIDVPAGGSDVLDFTFNVDASGAFSFDLDIANNDSDENPYDIQIVGVGATVSEMDVLGNDTSIVSGDTTPEAGDHTDFGNADTNGATISRTFTIANTGTADLTLSNTPAVTVGGTHAAEFALTVDATTPIIAGDETTFTITFNPGDSGLREATISIANNDGDENPYTFSIQGTGTSAAPEMDVLGNGVSIASGDTSPDADDHTDFGDISVASGSQVYTFTIQNTGSVDLNLSGTPIVIIGGAHAADFVLTSDATTPVSSAGGTTTFEITFDPSDSGLREAIISIANDDNDENPYTFSIQGTGTP
ncbi:MAG: choice-of-anchor D domain-containing protein [Anaerolineae bacterium]|nr:choice-of-anchor D domain-containing protein [Anaerolineae bacterium]